MFMASKAQIDALLTEIGVTDVDSVVEVHVCVHDVHSDEEAKHLCLAITREPEHVVLSREHELEIVKILRGDEQ